MIANWIEENGSSRLKKELDYYLNDVDHEEIPDYDITDALNDYETLMLEGEPNKELKRLYVDVQYAQEIDIAKVYSTHGNRGKYWFKLDGKYYQCVTNWETWINN